MADVNRTADPQRRRGAGTDDDSDAVGGYKKHKRESVLFIPVVNDVLSEKNKVCMNDGVELSVDLDFPPVLQVEPLHLCSIFSNLLDNAINGVKTLVRVHRLSTCPHQLTVIIFY